jgi:RNase P subunit RPR2
LQHAICSVGADVAPSTQVAQADVKTPNATSNEENARLQRTIHCIVCPNCRSVKLATHNFTRVLALMTGPASLAT